MVRKSYTAEQIINKLREAEILLNQGTTLPVVWKKIGVCYCTYYRWRKEHGGMRIEQAKRLKELEQENSRLKRRWRTSLWITPFSRKLQVETPKPVQETPGYIPHLRVVAYL